jgi:hypothetical protein
LQGVTVTPHNGTASTFAINASTEVSEWGTSSPTLANGDFVVVSAPAAAPTAATSIEIFPAQRGF